MVRFGEFEADLDSGDLRKAGRRIKLQHQPFQLLSILLERRGDLVSREELQRRLWTDGTVVEFDHSLNTALKKVRQALEDSAAHPRFVETVPRRGYRFIAPVSNGSAAAAPAPLPATRQPVPARLRALWLAGIALLGGAAYWVLRPGADTGPEPLTVQLTSDPTLEEQPTLSPDGNQVAFSWNGPDGSNFDIYVKQLEGQALLRLTTDPARDVQPAWSPDGRWIVFHRVGAGLVLISPFGGPERKLASAGTQPSWTADSQAVLFIDHTGPQSPQTVFQISVGTGTRTQLTFPPAGYWGDDSPAISPDAQTLAFVRLRQPGPGELMAQPRGGPARTIVPASLMAGLAWTPDSREIVFASARSGAWRLWRVEPGARAPKPRLVAGAGDGASWPALAPSRSDGGLLLAYESSFASTAVHQTRLDAGSLRGRPLVDSTRQQWHPRFSPSGARIAFTSDRSGKPQVWICDADGANCAQLTSFEVAAFGPQWSPDGSRIAFSGMASNTARVANVFVMDLKNEHVRQVTQQTDSEALVRSWSRDARSIYFHSGGSGEQRMWKIAVSGGEAAPVTERQAIDGQESANGKWFYFIGPAAPMPGVFGSPGPLWRVPVAGGPEKKVLDGASFFRWEVAATGIYFVEVGGAQDRTDLLKFFDFTTGRVSAAGALPQPVARYATGFSISPDRRSFLTVHDKPRASDLMLVKNLR